MNIRDYEIFSFGENQYREIEHKGKTFLLNKKPYLDIVLTDHCNQDCSFCIADLLHKKEVCNIEKFKEKILYAIEKFGVKEVLLLGGEPTVSKDIIPITKWLSDLNLLDKIVMTSNGARLSEDENFRKELFSSGLTHLNISFMSLSIDEQKLISGSQSGLTTKNLHDIYSSAKDNGIMMRINNNIFKGNNDTISKVDNFYSIVEPHCDSVKFSPILPVDSFSVVNHKTEWARKNLLERDYLYDLFTGIEKMYSQKYNVSVIENELLFGFVKNTMIPLRKPILLNWNFGEFTGMKDRVVKEHKINNIKLLPVNELSLSWNREEPEYFL